MSIKPSLRAILFAVGLGTISHVVQARATDDPPVFGVFVGSSPCGAAIREPLGIEADAECELIEWRLTLSGDAATGTPTGYHLRVRYGVTTPNQPGLSELAPDVQLSGTWRTFTGVEDNAGAEFIALAGGPLLLKVDANVLHVLNKDGSPIAGTGGWSYVLNRE